MFGLSEIQGLIEIYLQEVHQMPFLVKYGTYHPSSFQSHDLV